MTAFPPFRRTHPSESFVLSGLLVSSGQTWAPIVANTNWLNASGACLVASSCGDSSKNSVGSGATCVWRFRTYTRIQAIERIWMFQLTGAKGSTGCDIKAGSSATQTFYVTEGVTNTYLYTETIAAQASTTTDLTFQVTSNGAATVVQSISCWEQYRSRLEATNTDFGIDLASVRPGSRIYAPTAPTLIESISGVVYGGSGADPRRVGLFSWSVPASNPATRTGTYQAITGLGCPVLTRKLADGATTGTVYWSAYAKVNAGNGDVQVITSHSGVSDSVNVTGTSFAWTTPRAISVDCDDLSAVDGRQSSTWDEVTVNIRGNGGNTLSIAALSIYERP